MEMLDKNHSRRAFKGDLGLYRPLTTADGSLTFYSEHFREAFHSLDGAKGETLYNFIEGCEIVPRAGQYPLSILEVGLGMGRGYPATLQALGAGFQGELTFVSVEIDNALIDWCRKNTSLAERLRVSFPDYRDLKKLSQGTFYWWETTRNRVKLIVLPGNAVDTLSEANRLNLFPPFNAIYQDAFSPGKNPELWTSKWFDLLKTLSSPEVILSTYSASLSVRKELVRAGFEAEKRKGFGRKKASYRARIKESAKLCNSLPIVFFDGKCHFCNIWIRILLLADAHCLLSFAPLQGKTAKKKLPAEMIERNDSLVFVCNGTLFTKARAVSAIARLLPFPLRILALFEFIPFSESIYNLIALGRYKVFGKKTACPLPTNPNRFPE